QRGHLPARRGLCEHAGEDAAAFDEQLQILVHARPRQRGGVTPRGAIRQRRRDHLVVLDTHTRPGRNKIVTREGKQLVAWLPSLRSMVWLRQRRLGPGSRGASGAPSLACIWGGPLTWLAALPEPSHPSTSAVSDSAARWRSLACSSSSPSASTSRR